MNYYEERRWELERREVATAINAVYWLAAGYRLGGPWRALSAAIVTHRHRGWDVLVPGRQRRS